MITVVTHTNNKRPALLERTVSSVEAALVPNTRHVILECYENWAQARYDATQLDDYVVFVDDDDTIASESLRLCLECLAAHPGVGLIITNEIEVDLEGNALKFVDGVRTYSTISHHPRVAHHMCVINRRFVDPEVVALHNQFGVGIDWAIKTSAALQGTAVHIPVFAYKWTQHKDNMFTQEKAAFSKAIPLLSQAFRARWGLPKDNSVPVWTPPSTPDLTERLLCN